MDAAAVIGCFRGRSILITGSTGFLGKLLVEKILRVQPDVRKLYLLVRSPDAASAQHRVLTEVVGTELFDVLRSRHGADFNSLIKDKIFPLAGDIVYENCALPISTIEQISKEIDVIVSVAATTSFYERYDVALASNALGVAHVCHLANKCGNLKMLLHVSTGESLRKGYNLDVQAEIKLVENFKSTLRMQSSNDKLEKKKMKELGLKRARHFGWPNVYSLTKALGEMLLGNLGRDLPVVIVRPSIILSTFQDPIPGWIEGTRTIDMLYVAYNDQKLPCFIADHNVISDMIPGDMVINAMMVAMAIHWDQHRAQAIYHVTSGHRNPLNYSITEESLYEYFRANPRVSNSGMIVKNKRVLLFKKYTHFHLYMILRYKIALEMLHVMSVFGGSFSKSYNKLNRGYNFLMLVAKLYAPYVFFKGCFDDTNMRKLWVATTTDKLNEDSMFDCDPACINWSSYLVNTHIPAVMVNSRNAT
ncbi:alcohol-forming fatty acyl-CoA reductase-like isoform X2 [Triticum dicoccoides]|uniref:alcohol-forming fatty acyl-CoA reductase-like isoform X2 n=1 Tax=Triticum dicoccoides TaxID=85692 RepID=UPI00188E13F7|nr:alcohol-forming fatty acyl-CoA reductase-like isoform X2 [Triticum dicoccoides]